MPGLPPYIGKLICNNQVVGTGFLIHQDGLIATCYHVVKVAGEALAGKIFTFQLLATSQTLQAEVIEKLDAKRDIALLKTLEPLPDGTEIARLICSDAARSGMTFQVTGYGEMDDPRHSYTYLSALGSVVGTALRDGVDLLQLESKQILLGMSGAPVIVEELGGVVGVISGRYSAKPDGTWMWNTAWAARSEAVADLDEGLQVRRFLSLSTVRELFGTTVRQVNLHTVIPASHEEIRQYYEGAPLTWNIFAACGDVERDQYKSLVKTFATTANRTRMLCLSGEPGAGKSTLARRIAAKVAEETGYLLLEQLWDNKADELWYRLEAGILQYGEPLILLVDDIFRDPSALQVLTALNSDLPLTIIATTRSNELPYDFRSPYWCQLIKLKAPSPGEKTRVQQKLEQSKGKLTSVQQQHLEQANSWLEMMLETTTGENLAKIVYKSVEHLASLDKGIYHIYKYLCYAGQYNVLLPESLIAGLDTEGQTYKILEHPASAGLIFSSGRQDGLLRTLHPTIAREALTAYGRPNPQILLREMVNPLQPELREQRLFLANLLYSLLLNQQEALVKELLEEKSSTIDKVLAACGNAELIDQWVALYRSLHDQQKVIYIEALALNKCPETSLDWRARIDLATRQGTTEQIATLTHQLNDWLITNPEENSVRISWALMEKNLRHFNEARKLFRDILKLDSMNAFCWYNWALIERDLGNYEEARSLFREAVKSIPQNVHARQTWALMEKTLRNYEEARSIFKEVILIAPKDVHARQAWAIMERDLHHYEEASRLFAEAVKSVPENMHARQAWAIMEKDLGNYEEARRLFDEAIKIDPTSVHCWQPWAIMERDLGNYEEARRLFGEAIKIDPTSVHCWQAWAIMERDLRNYEEAYRLIREAIKVNPKDGFSLHTCAVMERERGNYEEARRLFNEAINVNPKDAYCWQALAEMERELGNYEEARRLFSEAIKVNLKDDGFSLHSWAVMEKDLGNYEEARRLIRKATEIKRRKVDYWHFWATMEKELGNHKEARRLFGRGTAANPKDAACWHSWATMEKELGNHKEARRLFGQGTRVNPHSPICWHSWATMEKELGNHKEARRLFGQGTRVNPHGVICWRSWAAMEKDLGNYEEARRLLGQGTRANPKDGACWQIWIAIEKELGNHKEARRLLHEGTRANPKAITLWNFWVNIEKELGNYEEVRHLLSQATIANPKTAFLWAVWAGMEKEQGNYEEAYRLFNQGTRANPQDAMCWQHWVTMEKEQGNYKVARRLLSQGTKANSKATSLWNLWVSMEKELGNYEEARRLINEATIANPKTAFLWSVWAGMEKEQGNYEEARRLFSTGTIANPQDAVCWQNWAAMEKELGNYGEARRLLSQGTRVNPKAITLWNFWISVEKELGSYEEARDLIEETIKDHPTISHSWYLCSLLEFEKGNYIKALQLVEQAIKRAPLEYDMLLTRGKIRFALSEVGQAQADFEQVRQILMTSLTKEPDNFILLNSLGSVLTYLARYEEAEISLRHSLEIPFNHQKADTHYGLAVLYEAQGIFEAAINEWKKVLEYSPHNLLARSKLEYMRQQLGI